MSDADANALDLRPLAGSELPDSGITGDSVDPDARIEATLVLRRPGAAPDPSAGITSSAEFASAFGASAADLNTVTSSLEGLGVQVLSTQPAARLVRIAAPASVVTRVFGTTLTNVAGTSYRARSGGLSVPAALDGVVTAVLGLDTRPVARPHSLLADPAQAAAGYSPLDLAKVYAFPANTDGAGHTIAIIELGGGYTQADLDAYFSGLGIAAPTVSAVGVDGASNSPGQDADGEVLLDIEVAGALAPKAGIVVYFAPNSDAGFVDAVTQAAHANPAPTAISISWGQSEDGWSAQSRTALDQALADAATLGVTVTAAAGDDGSNDRATDGKPHADFPASSPHALACGGTRLDADPGSGTVTSEVVWNNGAGKGATGGGISDAFDLPPWQQTVGVPPLGGRAGRGVPDVSAVADPQTGYKIRLNGQDQVIGGTSAVAPLWAALVTRLAQALNKPLGLVQPALYGQTAAGTVAAGFRDVTDGNNGAYTAGPGWDACTGLGVPDGGRLLAALGGSAAVAVRPLAGSVAVRVSVVDVDAALPLYQALAGGVATRLPDGSVRVGAFVLAAGGHAATVSVGVADVHAVGAAVVAAGGTILEGPHADGSALVARHPDGVVVEYRRE